MDLVAQIRDDPQRFNFINEQTPMGRWGYPSELDREHFPCFPGLRIL